MDQLPALVAQSNETERVVGTEKRHARLIVQQRLPLGSARNRQAEEIENGRRGVDEAGYALDPSRLLNQAGRYDKIRHMHVFLVEEKGVTEVALVLSECFSMVAEEHKESLSIQSSIAQTSHQV